MPIMTKPTPPAADAGDVKTFLECLRALDKGAVLERLSEAQAECLEGVLEHGKKGKITLTLTLEPSAKQAAEHVTYAAEIKIDKPGPTLGKSLFYIDDAGRLSRRDPRQADLEDLTPGPRSID